MSDSVDRFNNVLRELLNKHAPLMTSSITIRDQTPWYNKEIPEAKQIRRSAERKLAATRIKLKRLIYKQQTTAYHQAVEQHSTAISQYKQLGQRYLVCCSIPNQPIIFNVLTSAIMIRKNCLVF